MAKYSENKKVWLLFNLGSLMTGRVVKTLSYDKMQVEHFKSCNLLGVTEIKPWCGVKMRIVSVDTKKGVVKLSYDTRFTRSAIEWPINCLNKIKGIKLN